MPPGYMFPWEDTALRSSVHRSVCKEQGGRGLVTLPTGT